MGRAKIRFVPPSACRSGGRRERDPVFCMVLRARSFLAWRVVGVVGAAPGQINLPQPFSHTGVVLHGGVLELVALCACRSFRSVAVGFMDGVGDAAAATPSDGFFLLFCPRCCGVVSGAMVKKREFV